MKKWLLFASAALVASTSAQAQENGEGKDEKKKTLSEFVADFEKSDGLFPLYRNMETGEVFMEIATAQLGEEFIYFTYTENGPVEAGHFRGAYRDNRILAFNRKFDRIEVEAVNTGYYFDADNAVARAADANISRAPLGNLGIAAESEDGSRVLISADALLEKEVLHPVRPWQSPESKPGMRFTLGELSSDKTQIDTLANFPENTDIRVEYVFDNPRPINFGNPDITDPRSVAITVQHSFVQMPESGFEPRLDDYRVGFFTNQATDLTSADYAPYRDVINRWRLVKKDPNAAVSDPVEPITFWIENTTPVEIRDTIRDASLAWNVAFEAAGFSNAVEVKVQPDDADWDAGDIRYNVLRWTSSPNPPFGGYGPSFTNPRTGEILGADIMLEYTFLTNRMKISEVFDLAGFGTGLEDEHGHESIGGPDCEFSSQLQQNLIATRLMSGAASMDEILADESVKQGLYFLILHEIGHTLGLNHNMRSSSSVPLDALSDPGTAPVNSVMDYPGINMAAPGETQGQFMISSPGAYDIWAIQFGYTPDDNAIDAILARSTEPQLAFGNDADDVRAPGRHIDPRVMISDLSSDPITWAAKRSELVDATFAELPGRMLDDGDSYQSLLIGYAILSGQKAIAANVASRWIGGIYNNRAAVGQAGAGQPLVPVSTSDQRRALAVVDRIAFAPDAFEAGEALLSQLQVQRRGFGSFGDRIDPQPHARALSIQRSLLNHLLHPNVLARLTDARRYGGTYPVSTYMRELTGKVFDADRKSAVNTYRQNLQIEYVNRLIAVASGKGGGSSVTPGGMQSRPNYDYVARSAALASIDRIKGIAKGSGGNAETRAHRAHILSLIEEFERR